MDGYEAAGGGTFRKKWRLMDVTWGEKISRQGVKENEEINCN
jgi:hypothetical protein